jgi:hypothetical protein
MHEGSCSVANASPVPTYFRDLQVHLRRAMVTGSALAPTDFGP